MTAKHVLKTLRDLKKRVEALESLTRRGSGNGRPKGDKTKVCERLFSELLPCTPRVMYDAAAEEGISMATVNRLRAKMKLENIDGTWHMPD